MKFRLRYVVIFLVVVIVILQSLFSLEEKRNRVWITDAPLLKFFEPLVQNIANTSGFFSGLFKKYVFLIGTWEENRKLSSELSQTKIETIFLKTKIKKLDDSLKFAERYQISQEVFLSARILSFDIFLSSGSLLIDVGKGQGVQVQDVVLTEQGLVGRVVKTFLSSSQVLLLNDPNFSVDCLNENTGFRLLVSGLSENRLKGSRYPFLSHAEFLEGAQELKEGDEIVTSGFGTIFPAKIPVGTVREVQLFGEKIVKKVVIVPKVDFMKLANVFVLTERKNGK